MVLLQFFKLKTRLEGLCAVKDSSSESDSDNVANTVYILNNDTYLLACSLDTIGPKILPACLYLEFYTVQTQPTAPPPLGGLIRT